MKLVRTLVAAAFALSLGTASAQERTAVNSVFVERVGQIDCVP